MIPTWKLTDHWDQDAHEEEKLQSHKSEHAECFLVDNFLLGLKIPAKLQALIKFVSEEPLGSASQQIKVLLNPQLTRVIKYQHEGNHKWELFPEECKLSTSSRQKKQSRQLRTNYTNLKTNQFEPPSRRHRPGGNAKLWQHIPRGFARNEISFKNTSLKQICVRSTAQQNEVQMNQQHVRVIKTRCQHLGNRGWHWMFWNFSIWILIFQLRTNDCFTILHDSKTDIW